MNFHVTVIDNICHIKPALYGIGLSYGLTSEVSYFDFNSKHPAFAKTLSVANKLAHKQGGHNKFLETVTVTLLINAPRYWWSQFDTYRVGVTKQSESTMHTIMNRKLTDNDFIDHIDEFTLHTLNNYIGMYQETNDTATKELCFNKVKAMLPEGFMQKRVVCLNLKALQNMYMQRKNHRLIEWHTFFKQLKSQLNAYSICKVDIVDWVFGEDKEKENKEVETNLSHIKNLSTGQACTIFETLWDTCTCDLVCGDEPCDEECTKHMHEWLNKPYDGSLDAYLTKKEKEDND